MEEDLQKQIEARLAELPKDVQNAIASSDLEKRIAAVGTAHHLHIDQGGHLQDETLLVMLGFADPGAFPAALEQALGISKEVAEQLATEVSDQVFVPIRESMKAFMERRAAQQEPPKAAEQKFSATTPMVHPADAVLSAPTVTKAPSLYKTDPYREPSQ